MKMFLMSLIIGAISPWVAAVVACPENEERVTKAQVVVLCDDAGVTQTARVVLAADGGEATKGRVVTVAVGEGANDGRSEAKVFMWVSSDEKDQERGFLGVSIQKVPDALAAQFDIEGRGVIVSNVVEDSGAQRAGIEEHDVILTIDGEGFGDDVGQAVKLIKVHKPGDEVQVVVLRDGNEREITVTLGTRPAGAGAKFIFELAPDAEVEDQVRTFGRMLRRDDEGNWVMEDLGDLKILEKLPKNLSMFIPKSGNRSIQIFSEGGHKRIKTKVERDGKVIIVEQDDDEITVSRVDEDGNETEATYASVDELREADEEAAELLENTGHSIGVHVQLKGIDDAISGIDLDALGDLDLHFGHSFDFDFNVEEWKEHMGQWREHLEESLHAAHQAQQGAMKEVHALLERLREDGSLPVDVEIKALRPLSRLHTLRKIAKPKHTFTVSEDGTITVTIRRGDSELVQRFEDADDLERRNESLFEKYEKLMDAEDDE